MKSEKMKNEEWEVKNPAGHSLINLPLKPISFYSTCGMKRSFSSKDCSTRR